MTATASPPASPETPLRAHREATGRLGGAGLAVAAGVTATAVWDKGGFYAPDVYALPGVLAFIAISARRFGPPERRVVISTAGFVAWWLTAAAGWGHPSRAVPLAASMAGFAAAFAIGSGLDHVRRSALHLLLIAGGVTFAAVGLVGVGWRIYPLAMRAQGLWRLAGPVTYANTAGLLLAVTVLLIAGDERIPAPLRRAAFCMTSCALIATMSRGALLALALGGVLVGRSRLRSLLWPGILSVLASALLLATASSDRSQPLAIVAVAAASALAGFTGRRGPGPARQRIWLAVAAVVLLATGAGVLSLGGLHLGDAVTSRAGSAGLDRGPEWALAWDQARAHPFIGAGPEQLLVGTSHGIVAVARFAHNEYLQVGADAGLVGIVLLAAVLWAVGSIARRGDGTQAGAAAALAAVAVAGFFDFSWHLPAVGIVAGWIAALSTRGAQGLSPDNGGNP